VSGDGLTQVRCPRCGKLLAEATLGARLRVKCFRCHVLVSGVVRSVAGSPSDSTRRGGATGSGRLESDSD